MAELNSNYLNIIIKVVFVALIVFNFFPICKGNDILGCGGFVKSHASLDFSKIEIGLYTTQGSLKEKTECAPTNGYYFLPLYEKGEYTLKVHPPPGWSFEPSEVPIVVDGTSDPCSTGQDINFVFNGFGITGKVVTAGQKQGPEGVEVVLENDKGEKRTVITKSGGDFDFTPVIPGKYIVRASHPRWKLEPSVATVQVKEGNTAMTVGSLVVKGYDVSGTVTSKGNTIAGVHVLLYAKGDGPKFKVEGCTTALLQGVPDEPICFTVTDQNGVFTFGLVPAGSYYLLPLTKQPGQAKTTLNMKPDKVDFTVKHNSLFIKNAFEVVGYTVLGSVLNHPGGSGLSGVRVSVNGEPIGVTDGAGKYTIPNVEANTYRLEFFADNCEFDEARLAITPAGVISLPDVHPARWRVCGQVRTTGQSTSRTIVIKSDRDPSKMVEVKTDAGGDGGWCTFLEPDTYSANVAVSDQEKLEGLQYFPLSQKISVSRSPVDGVAFSQLKATLTGVVKCKTGDQLCEGLKVTLRALTADGTYSSQTATTVVKAGAYSFEEVLPGAVEVSVEVERLCWAQERHRLTVSTAQAAVPDFVHTGYALAFHASHDAQVEYSVGEEKGVLQVNSGVSRQCVSRPGIYTFTPTGCHKFEPATITYNVPVDTKPVRVNAVSHAAVVTVLSDERADELALSVTTDGHETRVGPLPPVATADGHYLYQHTLYLHAGQAVVVEPSSSSLLFRPSGPQSVSGAGDCRAQALLVRAERGLTVAGRLSPPVPGALVKLLADGVEEAEMVTGADGLYKFGPLEASRRYTVVASKESYVFAGPDGAGVIAAHRLAEIAVTVLDDADGTPLAGALVSVSGGDYRRNLATGADGRLTFPSLAPADYYVKPLMKEYKFAPPHRIVTVHEGQTYDVTLRGVRVAWSATGAVLSLGGAGVGGVTVLATPTQATPTQACATEEAATEPRTGAFRIRGLLPQCAYAVTLGAEDNAGLRLANAPVTLQVKDGKDIEGVKLVATQTIRLTDVNVLVRAANVDHYKTLRLKVALESQPSTSIFTSKVDAAGFTQTLNPGVMYALPRLPGDNRTYVVHLESSLSKATHRYDDKAAYFTSNGQFKQITFDFDPKVKGAEAEVGGGSLLLLPLVALCVACVAHRERLRAAVAAALQQLLAGAPSVKRPQVQQNILDETQINQIIQNVNSVNKRKARKVQ